jgi:hypothetical protein
MNFPVVQTEINKKIAAIWEANFFLTNHSHKSKFFKYYLRQAELSQIA